MIKISVVIPIYNTPEKWLRNSISSVLAQTMTEIEILLVDDGSVKPHVKSVCEEFVRQDARVQYYFKKNGGESDARRYGLGHARGEYIAYVDSDDWAYPNMCKTLYQMIRSGSYDMAEIRGRETKNMFADVNVILHVEKENATEDICQQDWIGVSGNREVMEAIFDEKKPGMGWSLWGKLFRTELLRRSYIVHSDITRGPDLVTLAEYSQYAQNYITSDRVLYLYNKENEQSVTRQQTVKSLTICECFRQLMLIYAKTDYKETYRYVRARYCENLYGAAVLCYYRKFDNYRKISRKIRRELWRYRKDIFFNPYLRQRGKCILAVVFPYAYVLRKKVLRKV